MGIFTVLSLLTGNMTTSKLEGGNSCPVNGWRLGQDGWMSCICKRATIMFKLRTPQVPHKDP